MPSEGIAPQNKTPQRSLARGTAWAAIDNWTQQLLQLATFLLVGNIIGPTELGVMAMALVFIVFLQVLLTNSFTDVLIQRKTLEREHLDAVFWAIAAAGALAATLSILAAPWIAVFFRTPRVETIVLALSPAVLLMGFTAFYEARLRRALNFRFLALRSIVAGGIASVTAFVLAERGYGVWSLVVYQLVWRSLEFLILMAGSGWLPRLALSWRHLAELVDYGLHTVGTRFVNYLSHNVDRLAVGAVLGAQALGIYTMALRAIEALTQALTGVFQGVALPVFARLQENHGRLIEAVRGAILLSSAIGLPTFVGLAVVAEPLVTTFLKPEWAPLVPVLQILCLVGAISTVTFFLGAALRALGHADRVFWVSTSALLFRIPAVMLAVQVSLEIVAATQVSISIVFLPIWLGVLYRAVGLRAEWIGADVLPAVVSCAAMVGVLWLFRHLIDARTPIVLELSAIVLLGMLSYAVAMVLLAPQTRVVAARFLRARVP